MNAIRFCVCYEHSPVPFYYLNGTGLSFLFSIHSSVTVGLHICIREGDIMLK